jgi:hypothetical protein
MKALIYIISSLIILQVGCKKDSEPPIEYSEIFIPVCINQKIDEIKSHPKGWGAALISEYHYSDQKVYLFRMSCCDRYNLLYDNKCNYLCAPSGGFTGGGDGSCTDFYSTAVLIREVWKDPR